MKEFGHLEELYVQQMEYVKTNLMTEIQCELWGGLSCIEEITAADSRELRDGTSNSRQTNIVLMT
jgi:hypothetical protein